MKKSKKSLILILAAAAILSMLLTIPVLAASTRKCYLIKNQNTTVYSNTALTKKYGTVYGSDEIKVLSVTSKYTRITYPISKGRTKTGYIKTSAILKGTSGPSYTARAKITTYKRPGGSTYGSVYKGDKVMILGTSGSYTQIKYPVSGGYKYAFVKTTNANKYIKPSSTSTSKPKQEKTLPAGWHIRFRQDANSVKRPPTEAGMDIMILIVMSHHPLRYTRLPMEKLLINRRTELTAE